MSESARESAPSSAGRRLRVYRAGSEDPSVATPPVPEQPPAEGRRPKGLSTPVIFAILVALVAGALAGGLAAGSVLSQDSSYRSTTVVEIRRNDLFVDVNPGTISVLNALRSKYAALITTEPVVGPAAESTGLPARELRRSLGAAITSDSLLFYPYATAGSPERAQRIASAATEALIAYADDEQRAAGVPAGGRIELRVVQDAALGSEIGPDSRRATVVGLAAGFIVAIGAYAVAGVFWIRRRSWVPGRSPSDA